MLRKFKQLNGDFLLHHNIIVDPNTVENIHTLKA